MTILVTGATANIGRMVVDHLLARGAGDVRALTVNPERAALPDGVEAVRGNLRRPETLDAAFDGVDAMYLAPAADTVEEVLDRAAAAGVRHVVALSGEPETWWGSVTAAVEAKAAAWTHLWPHDFMENARMWLPQIRETGEVREPWPDASSTPTAMTDIAEVAAVALTRHGHEGKAYTLTGATTVSRREMVDAIAAATGRPIRFVTASAEETRQALVSSMGEQGAAFFVGTVLPLMAGTDAETDAVTVVPRPNGVVEDVTGRPATTFAAWAADHADELRAAVTA